MAMHANAETLLLSTEHLVKPNTLPALGQRNWNPGLLLRGDELPDHTQLPAEDGVFAKSFLEFPQSVILTSSMEPVLNRLHPNRQYVIGQDSGIYWDVTEPPQDGAVSPDWFYVPNRPPMLDGLIRRSYVLWKEIISPLIVIEFVSGDGSEEHDQTPFTGKFWVYENAIKSRYYAIYNVSEEGTIELYVLRSGRYELVAANARKHYPIPELEIELGLWQGTYMHMNFPWLRVWDTVGNLLLTSEERAIQARQRTVPDQKTAEQKYERSEQERQAKEFILSENERYKAKLRALGINPEEL